MSAFKFTRFSFKIIRPGLKPRDQDIQIRSLRAETSPKSLRKNAGFRGAFDFKEGLPNSQGVLNNPAKMSLKRRPILKQVQDGPTLTMFCSETV